MQRQKPLSIRSTVLGFLLFVLAACTPIQPQTGGSPAEGSQPEGNQEEPTAAPLPTDTQSSAAEATQAHLPTETPMPDATEAPVADCDDPFGDAQIRFTTRYWDKTNFCKHSVDYSEFLSGGPPPDGIPAIDEPKFESITEADQWLGDNWPVMFFEWEGDARAYPLAILMWHEIVNDVVGGLPVTLTFCPLCNATLAFNRVLPDGTVLDFGTSGNLRNSDLVMYDRQTQSWWQQFTGTALVGDYTGTQLEFLPSQIISWGEFKASQPEGMAMSRNTGHIRDYGRNPYVGYDDISTNPFLFTGVVDGRLPATSRVVAVEIDGVNVAYPFDALSEVKVVNDEVAENSIVVFWQAGTNSALDQASFENSRDIGSTAVFLREVDGQSLTFKSVEGGFEDEQTGSIWNIFGEAVSGPLAGSRLTQLISAEHFWFAWAAFKPDTIIWQASS